MKKEDMIKGIVDGMTHGEIEHLARIHLYSFHKWEIEEMYRSLK